MKPAHSNHAAMRKTPPITMLSFGLGGTAQAPPAQGWSLPEPGFTWSIGPRAAISLPTPPGAGPLMLELSLTPFLAPPHLPAQTLRVLANATLLGEEQLSGDAILAYRVPKEAWAGQPDITITLEHPQATAPSTLVPSADVRLLGMAVRFMRLTRVEPTPQHKPRLAPVIRPDPAQSPAQFWARRLQKMLGLSLEELLLAAESLGHNCEFGMVQRHFGLEPLGLLRFGAIEPAALLRGLDCGFAGLGRQSGITLETGLLNGKAEFLAREPIYGLTWHTGQFTESATAEAVLAKQPDYLNFLRRLTLERLAAGGRICVLHHPSITDRTRALPFRNRIRTTGNNILLYVTAEATRAPGTVIEERPFLYHGYIDRLVPMHEAHLSNHHAWVCMLANTLKLAREAGFTLANSG